MNGIEIEVIWFDEDAVELCVRADNGRFAGAVDLYVARGDLARVADTLRGFPETVEDRRDLELGSFDAGYAGGGAELVFHCIDLAAHTEVALRLAAEPEGDVAEAAEFHVRVEAAGIDRFVEQLAALEGAVGNVARLPSQTP